MAARLTQWPYQGFIPDKPAVERILEGEGLQPIQWQNEPGTKYGWRHRPEYKVLYCIAGSITVHTTDGDLVLGPGDRVDLDPGTSHAITVGPSGAQCLEARR